MSTSLQPFPNPDEVSSDHRNFTTTPLEMLAAVGAKRQNLLGFAPSPAESFNQPTDLELAQQAYFSESPSLPASLQGSSPEYDPINLALLSTKEAQLLFNL